MARRRRRSGRSRKGRSFWSFANWMNLAIVAVLGYVGIQAFGNKMPAVKDVLDETANKVSDMVSSDKKDSKD